ncbi:MAG TPA: peptidase M50 [Mycobacterium sp.]|nr:peptidase M50 [Mycobacterium sp.]
MNAASNAVGVVVLGFADRPIPAPLAAAPTVSITDPSAVDDLLDGVTRLVVVGADADLAAVLTRLLRCDRLDIEVAHAAPGRAARRALTGTAGEVPLIRDETGTVLVGAAWWRGVDGPLHGEAVVDDTVLFDGKVPGVRIEPLAELPGVRATVVTRFGRRRWVSGRAAQLGTTGARVVRDGVPVPRPVRRSTFYRHTQGWLRVR